MRVCGRGRGPRPHGSRASTVACTGSAAPAFRAPRLPARFSLDALAAGCGGSNWSSRNGWMVRVVAAPASPLAVGGCGRVAASPPVRWHCRSATPSWSVAIGTTPAGPLSAVLPAWQTSSHRLSDSKSALDRVCLRLLDRLAGQSKVRRAVRLSLYERRHGGATLRSWSAGWYSSTARAARTSATRIVVDIRTVCLSVCLSSVRVSGIHLH
jgi:hypothetical protein